MGSVAGTHRFRSLLNFRDTGGKALHGTSVMRTGVLFRSASPDHIHPSDAVTLKSLGVKTIIDLRSPAEAGTARIRIDGAERLNLPLDFQQKTRERLMPYIRGRNAQPVIAEISNQLYLEILDAAVPVFREVMEVLADPGRTPVLIHCQAGKDRTGILTALVLKALGAGHDDIITDFMKSNPALESSFRRRFLIRSALYLGFFPYRNLMYAVTVRQRNIESVLDRLDNHYGGIEAYLEKSGADPSLSSRVRELLISRDSAGSS